MHLVRAYEFTTWSIGCDGRRSETRWEKQPQEQITRAESEVPRGARLGRNPPSALRVLESFS